MIVAKICKQCGTPFQGWPKARYCQACRKVKQGERDLKVIACKRCKTQFKGGPNALYCQPCRVVRQAERDKECYRKKHNKY